MAGPESDHDRRLKILVVDDEPGIIEVARLYLESEGYDVVTADSGVSLLSVIGEAEPNIVLLDIRMPDIDGLQCLRQIRSEYPDTEVIMMSGFATRQMAQKALELGAFDYLGKPLSFSHLIQVIEQIRITKFMEST